MSVLGFAHCEHCGAASLTIVLDHLFCYTSANQIGVPALRKQPGTDTEKGYFPMQPHDSTPHGLFQPQVEKMFREIPLSQGYVAIVDSADYEWLIQWKWYWRKARGQDYGYAVRMSRCEAVPGTGQQRIIVFLHNVILNPPAPLTIDHKNGDTLDNRRANLRLATRTQQNANCGRRRDNKSGYKGVSWKPRRNKWCAEIRLHYKHRHIGYFDTPQQAALAYNAAAQQLFGEFCRLNIVKLQPAGVEQCLL